MRKTTELVECFEQCYNEYLLETIWNDLLNSLKIAIKHFDFENPDYKNGVIKIVYIYEATKILTRCELAKINEHVYENEKIRLSASPFQRFVYTDLLEKFKSMISNDPNLTLFEFDKKTFYVCFSTNPDKYFFCDKNEN